jgi:putative methionine-R-sulfoxide reductase with GAF domain
MARDYSRAAETLARQNLHALDATERMQGVVDALWDELHAKGVSWVGFYLEDPGAPEAERLVLGPRRDKPACSPIGLHGVCGACFTSGKTQIVRDVRDLGDGYVACDPRDMSEIVVPIIDGATGRCTAVLDLDSFEVGSFDERDEAGLKKVLTAAGFGVGG